MIVGIDLGTTNSLVAVWKEEKPHLIPNALNHYLTPSVVGLDHNGEILVGQPAVERMLVHPELTARTFKRYMGTDKVIRLGTRPFRPEELSSLVLRRLKEDAEIWLGQAVDEAVISVPAYFNDAQRKATRIAGQLAGLTVERLVNEPTAAALAYGLEKAKPESRFLVYDLGGGTFDVTILELFEGVMEVRATAGDNFLGGEDFVELLIDRFLEEAGTRTGMTRIDLDNATFYQTVRREAERAKCRLTEAKAVNMSVKWKDKTVRLEITEEQFKTWSETLLSRLRKPVERALRDAKLRPSELDEILLVGGATRMPLVRNLVARMFGRFPSTQINPDEAVALGAAVQAALKERHAALREVVLTDVCPYTLGVEIAEKSSFQKRFITGLYLPIIERNTVVPASRMQQVQTLEDNQTQLDVRIFQGESRLVADNIFLGNIHVSVPPRRKGQETVDIRFTYDINGLLEVEATVSSTGIKKSVVIEGNPGVMTSEEIAARLAALSHLKIHPREQTENRTLLARAERLYEEHLHEIRLLIGEHAKEFTEVMERQDPREISKARERLSAFLDEIEKGDSS